MVPHASCVYPSFTGIPHHSICESMTTKKCSALCVLWLCWSAGNSCMLLSHFGVGRVMGVLIEFRGQSSFFVLFWAHYLGLWKFLSSNHSYCSNWLWESNWGHIFKHGHLDIMLRACSSKSLKSVLNFKHQSRSIDFNGLLTLKCFAGSGTDFSEDLSPHSLQSKSELPAGVKNLWKSGHWAPMFEVWPKSCSWCITHKTC